VKEAPTTAISGRPASFDGGRSEGHELVATISGPSPTALVLIDRGWPGRGLTGTAAAVPEDHAAEATATKPERVASTGTTPLRTRPAPLRFWPPVNVARCLDGGVRGVGRGRPPVCFGRWFRSDIPGPLYVECGNLSKFAVDVGENDNRVRNLSGPSGYGITAS
jgi:hypothetical protein